MKSRVSTKHLSAFLARVERGPGCWVWLGSKDKKGYGRQNVGGAPVLVHRLAYFFATDRDPGNSFVCHRCDNPSCVRPDHLFLGTNAENVTDCKTKGRNHVPAKALTREQGVAIRRERSRLGRAWDPVSLAHRFGVSRMTIYRAARAA